MQFNCPGCAAGGCNSLGELAFWREGDERTSKNGKRTSLDRKGIVLSDAQLIEPCNRLKKTETALYLGMMTLPNEARSTSQLFMRDGALIVHPHDRTLGEGLEMYVAHPVIRVIGETEEIIQREVEHLGFPYDRAQIDKYCPIF